MVLTEIEACMDFPILQKCFSKRILNRFEKQLNQYLNMSEVTEDYLQSVPLIVCWYEGMIGTQVFIQEFGKDRHYKGKNDKRV
ncbi:MAG: hypothetical protein LBQ71_15480 [Hungatella sp.]|jgi:hypothetical protein|nr:hypothetical protein [Hungatella sp.]